MKKFFALIMALVMMLGLCACTASLDADTMARIEDYEARLDAIEAQLDGGAAPAEEAAEEEPVEEAVTVEDPFYVWAWNTDFVTILEQVLPNYLSDEEIARIQFVNVGDSSVYQEKIDAILADPDNEEYPDVMLLEVGYVQKYVQSGYLMNVADLGITADDMANMYDYNLSLGTDAASGDTYALFWQATPGCWQIRADLAEEYLGTTDPDELQAMFATWDDVVAVSESVNEASGGKVKLLSGADDLKYVFCNGARTSAWYDENDTIVIDPAIEDYLNVAAELNGLTFDVGMWSTEWATLKDGDGVETEAAIAFTGCPWYSYWCLTDTWNDNAILIQGPQAFYWGGTGLAATADCSDAELAYKILYYCTCDTQAMIDINTANGDYVNNAEAIAYIQENGSGTTSTFSTYNDQDIIGFYASKCEGINVLAVGEDQIICENLLPSVVDSYESGEVDLDTAVANLKSSIHDTYSYLSID